jgi:hypothetical protein
MRMVFGCVDFQRETKYSSIRPYLTGAYSREQGVDGCDLAFIIGRASQNFILGLLEYIYQSATFPPSCPSGAVD